ncbi:ATP-binding protein [Aquimarina sp. ERC-38]|uniref:ATP-binding protein n=1 Tax=Aquimarina sp. ERC-38 TaxID=2949996 RepID=UPI0022461231|nr:ATP-binding protein [Aquimarina sp. ERC-38]UZO81596.1 ATP-binding protein [Aquimarina sp. ERC-38]
MENTKRSVTYKIIAGYSLATILAFIAFWVIYNQITDYAEINNVSDDNSKKLILVGEATTSLYEAESLTRNIIQTSDIERFENYRNKVNSIISTIDRISELSFDTLQIKKMDSIKLLIDNKNQNFASLIDIYRERKNRDLQQNVIDQLKKTSEEYGNYRDLDKRFNKYTRDKKRALKRILELSKEDNAKRLTNQTLDSVANRFYKALAQIEAKERQYENKIEAKEDELLKNDQIITKQLRDLMTGIELNVRKEYNERLSKSRKILNRTSNFFVIFIAISLVIALIFLILITTDVSKSQKFRNELEAEKNYTEKLLKTRESLINTVTHDLRSPLNTVIGYSDLLEKTGLTTKQTHYLNHLKRSSDYMLHLVNDLLDLSKLEAGRMNIEQLPFLPKKLIDDTVSANIPAEDKKHLRITLDIKEELDRSYQSDPFRIKQVLTNLINNAYKFTETGTIRILGYLEEKELGRQHLVIVVQDTGIGITEKQQQHIFQEFAQGDNSTEKKFGGFGLGLAITKKIIDLLGGSIILQSTPGDGSTFTVSIPVIPSLENIPVTEAVTVEEEAFQFNNQKVLLIDDDPAQLSLTQEVITLAGLQYDSCINGKEAVQLIQEKSYDLILTDIQMPIMDGFEFLAFIKQYYTKDQMPPIIALSGRTDIDREDYIKEGFTNSLRKPYAPADLLEAIATILPIRKPNITNDPVNLGTSNELFSLEDIEIFAQGDKESFYAILDTFVEGTTDNLAEFSEAIQNQDKKKIKSLAHKMLPMFRQIKAFTIIPKLETLEDPNRSISDKEISLLPTELIKPIEALISELKVI